jgi:hypothetical protein
MRDDIVISGGSPGQITSCNGFSTISLVFRDYPLLGSLFERRMVGSIALEQVREKFKDELRAVSVLDFGGALWVPDGD